MLGTLWGVGHDYHLQGVTVKTLVSTIASAGLQPWALTWTPQVPPYATAALPHPLHS